mmetsp:Transcript_10257/g.26280  ORF Transcript_10257/g.26280 Transcript_10257/m.26280 type:complete len:426 (-) Transcript_10257:285-1562(-)|eukprot:CAMPEP_0182932978 /NCGR_PEP_ID=MMETSP0105_2-20130417/32712_1 /TAXON_ID=81532 ORGANISM="Acanthoeca-like sp., Strain 10tr" /NCGR_SAMPLE_ID=MMETSP0105_2 /ASSEMBLY_ACC=CAM_ASM_000205 /LENGTH=425 /DNA_ID=CAMNT_0025071643 /DNA_START=109 /DNA_END=1386 /DNA_ORIENTATION=+
MGCLRSLRDAFEAETARGKFLRILYSVSTFVIMFPLVRVWGQAMPTHSYFYSMSWAIGFIPSFVLLLVFVRSTGTRESVLDANWPMIKQSSFIGLSFYVNYFGVSAAAPHVQGAAQVIITVLPLALSVAFNWLVFRREYSFLTLAGVLMIIAASVVQIAGPGVEGDTSIKWAIVFLIGNLPTVLWSVYFEGFHKFTHKLDGRTNTMELRMIWTNVFLVLWLLALYPFFGLAGQPPMESFWDDFKTAAVCAVTGKGGYPAGHRGTLGDDCEVAQIIFWPTLVIAAVQAHSQIVISRHDTGLLATMILNVSPFLCDIYFYFTKHFEARYDDSLTNWDWIALGIAAVGVVIFSVNEVNREDTAETVQNSSHIQWFMSNDPPNWFKATGLYESDEDRYRRLTAQDDVDEERPLLPDHHDGLLVNANAKR